jgi:SAM-dependent methyltransferase
MAFSSRSNSTAYDSWAATYPPAPHNPLMRAEQQAMIAQWPDVTGACALDLACGTGRYGRVLTERGAARIISFDLSPEMLQRLEPPGRVRGDMMHMPFAAGVFDFIVSGLAVGHAPDLSDWMRETARILAPGGMLLYSDFHPDAAAAGMTRSFTDQNRRKHTLSHFSYGADAHCRAATEAGLIIEGVQQLRVGEELHEAFAGSETFYRRWQGTPVILIVRAHKVAKSGGAL